MPSFRDRVIFQVVQKVNGIPVASYICKRRQVNSLETTVPKMILTDGRSVVFEIYEGLNGPQQRRGMPIQWEPRKVLVAGADLQER